MAAIAVRRRYQRQLLRRNRIFRDRTNPFDVFDDAQIFKKFRFHRMEIVAITDSVRDELELSKRRGSLTPLLQVLITLRYHASGAFQDLVGETIGVDQSTVCRTIQRVTDAFLPLVPHWVKMPQRHEADETMRKFQQQYRTPNVFGCIDGTQIRIQAPSEYEHEFVNRKNYHSINVQVVCDADQLFINCVAQWPGSVHDARILRESTLFRDFEGNQRPIEGVLLGDSGYMVRDWLFTPIVNPATPAERSYNFHHSSARSTVERTIGVLKRRWHCLRGLRLEPAKACRVIKVCVMLHNQAQYLNLDDPSDSDDESDDDGATDNADSSDDSDDDGRPANYQLSERVRTDAGKAARHRYVQNFFPPRR